MLQKRHTRILSSIEPSRSVFMRHLLIVLSAAALVGLAAPASAGSGDEGGVIQVSDLKAPRRAKRELAENHRPVRQMPRN
jgi:hypothetical protein